jgi:hypothetical protein
LDNIDRSWNREWLNLIPDKFQISDLSERAMIFENSECKIICIQTRRDVVKQFQLKVIHWNIIARFLFSSNRGYLTSHFSLRTSHFLLLIFHFSFLTSHFALCFLYFAFFTSRFSFLISHF